MNQLKRTSKHKAAFTLLELAGLLVGLSLFSTYSVVEGAFTLIEVSLVLLVLTILGGAVLGKLTQNTRLDKTSDMQRKLDKIELALLNYGKVNGRLPCPADGSKQKGSDSLFGMEAANPGSCVGGSPKANFDDTVDTVGGVVPVRTLAAYGLQDTDIFDPYGDEFAYFVSKNSTKVNAFQLYPVTSCVGNIKIYDGSTPAQTNLRTSTAIALVLSYGVNGHGAFQSSGSRKFIGSTNADELLNCHCGSTSVNGPGSVAFNNYFILHPAVANASNPLNTFDDVGRYYRRAAFSGVVSTSPPAPPPPPAASSPPPPAASPPPPAASPPPPAASPPPPAASPPPPAASPPPPAPPPPPAGCTLPLVLAVTPLIEPLPGGETFTLWGSGFTGVTSVGIAAGVNGSDFTVVNDNLITGIVGIGSPGYFPVGVDNACGPNNINPAQKTAVYFGWLNVPPPPPPPPPPPCTQVPVITSFSPASLAVGGGTPFTITGSGFTGAYDVQLLAAFPYLGNYGYGVYDISSFTIVNDNTITGISPDYSYAESGFGSIPTFYPIVINGCGAYNSSIE